MVLALIAEVDRVISTLDKYNLKVKLSNTDESYYNSIKFQDDKNRTLASRYLLQILINKLPIKKQTIDQIYYSEFGKPLLPNVSFSISHSSQKVAIAISNSHIVGIDLQKHIFIDFNDYKMFLSVSESEQFQYVKDENKLRWFYDIWCQKEAIMKADGRGMKINPANIILKNSEGVVKDLDYAWYNLPFKN